MIKRAESLSRHRGEWAFPGGSIESGDDSLLDTALRETEEEIGIERGDIDVWGPLDAVVTGTGYIVWPFGGKIAVDAPVNPDAAEVAEVIRMPLDVVVEERSHRTITRLDVSTGREFGAYAYEGRIIWGATARMLSQVGEVMKTGRSSGATGAPMDDRSRATGGNGV